MKFRILFVMVCLSLLSGPAIAEDDPELYFISPADGAEIRGTIRVVFGLRGDRDRQSSATRRCA